jgi:WD40 repeat protein
MPKSIWIAPDSKTLAIADLVHPGRVAWWETSTGKQLRRWSFSPEKRHHPDRGDQSEDVEPVAFWPDGQAVVFSVVRVKGSGTSQTVSERALEAWDTRRNKRLWKFSVLPRLEVAFPRIGGNRFASAASFKDFCLRSMTTGKELKRLDCDPTTFTISGDGKVLASADFGPSVLLWDTASGKRLGRRLPLLASAPWEAGGDVTLALSQDGKRLAVAQGAFFHLWDTVAGKERPVYQRHTGPIHSLEFVGRPARLYVGSGYGLTCWDPATWSQTAEMPCPGPETGLYRRPVSLARGLFLATKWDAHRPAYELCDLASGRALRRFPIPWEKQTLGRFSPDGKILVLLSGGAWQKTSILLYEVDRCRLIERLAMDNPVGVEFSADGTTLACWGQDRVVHLRNVTGKQIRAPAKRPITDGKLALSPDGSRLVFPPASGQTTYELDRETRLLLWDTATGKKLYFFAPAPRHPGVLTFSSDGRMVASVDALTSLLRVWEVATGKERLRLDGHQGDVLSLVFSPDGKYLLSGGEDGTVLVWDLLRPPAPARTRE